MKPKKSEYPTVRLSNGNLIEIHYLHKKERRSYCISVTNAFKRYKLPNGYEVSWWVHILIQKRRNWVTEEVLFMLCDVIRSIRTRKKKPDWEETELYISRAFRQIENEMMQRVPVDELPKLTWEFFK